MVFIPRAGLVDLDPRVLEVLEALEDEEYVGDFDEAFFGDLNNDQGGEFYDNYDDDDNGEEYYDDDSEYSEQEEDLMPMRKSTG